MLPKTLGPFQIKSKAGAGGMGEVYRARDTRLNRTVAIKVLPADLSLDQQLRDRLRREAMAISRLNHPYVCTLYDIGHDDGVDYLVLEYLEGTPLSARLSSGPLPFKEALTIAAQVADGLDAAHRRGIVHRDLKPGNVMLTAGGAKLLDFGLAKEHVAPGAAAAMVATGPMEANDPATAEGTLLGTLQYMSPEQLHGQTADARSDLFSFGAMLYEMVTGEAPFQGKSQASVIASILEKEPAPVTKHLPIAPKALERLITRCLDKDPDARYQNARDVMHDLQWIAGGGANDQGQSPAAQSKDRSVFLPVLAAVLATVAIMSLGAWVLRGSLFSTQGETATAPQPMIRAKISLPEGHRIAGWASPTVAISDDGSTLAFVTMSPEGKKQLYVRPIDAAEAILVPDSETAEGPVFSPDGRWILFAVAVSGGARNIPAELRIYSLESALTQTLCQVRDYFGADWREDGTIVWMDQSPKGLWRINAKGGSKENFLTTYALDGKEHPLSAGWLSFLPDGKRVLVSLLHGGGFLKGAVLDLETGLATDLGMEGRRLLLLPDGRLAWVDKQGTLMVAPFDAAAGRLLSAGRAVDRNISIGGAGCAVVAVSGNGTAVLTRGPIQGSGWNLRRVVRLGEDASRTLMPVEEGVIRGFDMSPDGSRIVLVSIDGIRIHNLNRGGVTDLPLGDVAHYSRVKWSPDGKWIAFPGSHQDSTTLDVYLVAANGMAPPRILFKAESEAAPAAWDRDSKSLLVGDFATDETTRIRVLRVPLEGGSPQELELGEIHGTVHLAPQGNLIAYIQPQGDTYSVIVRTYPDLGPKLSVASGDYWEALWSENGNTLYAFGQDGVDAFTLERDPRLAVESQRRLITDMGEVSRPAVAPGGKGFFVLEDVPGAGVITEVEVVANWVTGLP